jgi:ribosome-associated translation inhibitor RaiA
MNAAREATRERRTKFAAALPTRAKRTAGATSAARTPANVRTFGVQNDESLRDYVRDRLGRKLGKFAERIERVTVRFTDVNGPRGGVDVVCAVKVVLSGLDSVVVEEHGVKPREAFDRAADVSERATRRSLGRARDVPVTRGRRATKSARSRGVVAHARA